MYHIIRISCFSIMYTQRHARAGKRRYYIAPASFVCLSIPWVVVELPSLLHDMNVSFSIPIFVSNALAAFALNMSVFLLIGKTSALTMNIAGVIKDWLLIALSYILFHAAISQLNIGGYLLAFAGVCWWVQLPLLPPLFFISFFSCVCVCACVRACVCVCVRWGGGGGLLLLHFLGWWLVVVIVFC
jgi:hypothetical protein